MPALDPIRRSILFAGLAIGGPAFARSDSTQAATITDNDFDEVVHWAVQERLDGLAWLALAAPESPWRLEDSQRARLLDAHLGGLRATLASEAAAVWATGVLHEAGVTSWLLKGLASGHLDYPDPALRTSFDADLLVARADLGRALDALLAAGCSRTTPPLRAWWERRYARAVELVSPDGIEIDLHAAIVDGARGVTLDHDRLRDRSTEIELAGRRCNVLSPPARLLAASYALVLSRGLHLRLVRDITQLTTGGVDVEASRRLAGDGVVIVDAALARCDELFAGDGSDASDEQPSGGWSSDALAAWKALSVPERPLYAFGVVWPSRANLRSRGLTRTVHLRRLVTTARSRRP